MSLEADLDLLVVGAGPTGIGLGAEAVRRGLRTLLVDRGPLAAAIIDYPAEMLFFTTRDRLEIAGIPFAIPEDKPNRRQAVAYYQGVASAFGLSFAPFEEVVAVDPGEDGFTVTSRGRRGETRRRARAVAIATGYFGNPQRLGVPGEDLPWVRARYREPWAHFGEPVVVVGGGNSGAEAALDLFRHGAKVTLVHHRPALKETVKYWVKPDLENRIADGEIRALLGADVLGFADHAVEVRHAGSDPASGGVERVSAAAAYVLIGYEAETALLRNAGIAIDPESGAPHFDTESCETAIPGLYVAGTVQAGRETHRIFIENSRDHGVRIAEHLERRLRGTTIANSAAPVGTLPMGS